MSKLMALEKYLQSLGPVAVAVSGGVDSMTLAVVAHRVNPNSQQFHAVSPAVPSTATERVKRYAQQEGWQLHIVNAREVDDQRYRANPVNRCYYCKSNLYNALAFDSDLPIVSGTNLDDLSDFRPGLRAADEFKVSHPFVEAGIDKNTIRAIAKHLQLHDLHELPAAPCLASRVTTGIEIDPALLPVIDKVETKIWQDFGKQLNLSAVRCRILPDKISIQLQGEIDFDAGDKMFSSMIDDVKDILQSAGYDQFAAITVDPYQRGSAFVGAKSQSITPEKIRTLNLG